MQTALISALTAAVVTLLIEYAAKPRLEARKERIVESARTRRDLLTRAAKVRHQIILLLGLEYNKKYAELSVQATQLAEDLVEMIGSCYRIRHGLTQMQWAYAYSGLSIAGAQFSYLPDLVHNLKNPEMKSDYWRKIVQQEIGGADEFLLRFQRALNGYPRDRWRTRFRLLARCCRPAWLLKRIGINEPPFDSNERVFEPAPATE